MSLKSKYPYIISDIDGTIANDNYFINHETITALLKYQEDSNYHLFLASGRLDLMAKEYFSILKIQTPIISCNGALIRDGLTNEIIFQMPIEQSIAAKIIASALDINIDHVLYSPNMIYGKPTSNRIKLMLEYNAQLHNDAFIIPIDCKTDYYQLIVDNEIQVLKILFIFKDDTEFENIKKIVSPFANNIEAVLSQKDLYDIQAANISKGSSFLKLCEIKGYNPSEFIFYGDNYNDLELAKVVGYPVAMGNAVDALKAISVETILDVNQNGVAIHLFDKVLS